jgi:type III secretion protein V
MIDAEEARARRHAVERESQLYGAMDGAMKFVKGDAIAGLIIVAVNLLGGMIIGTTQRGLSAAQAARTYSVLSIGDGLVAQIPALFIAVCAGMIVTRVQSNAANSNVGRDIGTQILAQPKAILIAGVVALGMGLIPGMPGPIFVALSAPMLLLGYALARGTRRVVNEKTGAITEVSALQVAAEKTQKAAQEGANEFAPAVPLIIDVAPNLRGSFDPGSLSDELLKIRRALYFDLGVPFPGIQLRYNDGLPADAYGIVLSEVPVSQGKLRPGYLLVRESTHHLDALGVAYDTDRSWLPDIPTLWVSAERAESLRRAGVAVMEPSQVLTYHLAYILKKYASDFIGVQETKFLLSSMEQRFPDLVKEAARVIPIHKIAEILQRLVSEDISIRDLRRVLEALIEWGQKEKDSVMLTEYVRSTLKHHITHKFAGGHNMLAAYLLAPDVENTVRSAIRQTSAGSYLALDPSVGKQLVQALKSTVGNLSAAIQKPVLLTSMDIRRYMRKMIERDLRELPVLSYQELTQEINIQPLARIDL